jgi:hypothetical protein
MRMGDGWNWHMVVSTGEIVLNVWVLVQHIFIERFNNV